MPTTWTPRGHPGRSPFLSDSPSALPLPPSSPAALISLQPPHVSVVPASALTVQSSVPLPLKGTLRLSVFHTKMTHLGQEGGLVGKATCTAVVHVWGAGLSPRICIQRLTDASLACLPSSRTMTEPVSENKVGGS